MAPVPAPREPSSSNSQTRDRIADAMLELMADGNHLNHDAVAARAGVSRRTVYRYFPDQDALRHAACVRMSPGGKIPDTLDDLLGGLEARFAKFDRNAAAMTVALASAEGRAMRNQLKVERDITYRGMFGNEVTALGEPDRSRAIAVIQLLSSGFVWREMRDQWDMQARDMAIAANWAIAVLRADLRRRGDKPLAEGDAEGSVE
ncbi:MAG: TetR/AcrR family transcriptional regulator [Sphingomonas sp.]|uniref:TetR/AcrR family transcriptional regulator n=1 Tax=Sphingomonas sp. TaxID=28214 RepID=UPI003F7F104E